jgi:hypothetical protein
LDVTNHCGSELTFNIAGEAAAHELVVEPGTTESLALPAGQYGYTASTITYAVDPDRPKAWRAKEAVFMDLTFHGTTSLQITDTARLSFTVLCERWSEEGCWSPRLVVDEEG